MNSTQYEELCRFYISRMLRVEIDSIRSGHIPNPIRQNFPPYEHQIDLYWETEDAVSRYLSIANAKWRGTSRVDQPEILLLAQVRQKVSAHKALMITNSSFTRGALAAAQDDRIGLHIVTPSFDRLLLPERDKDGIQKVLAEIEAKDGRVFNAQIANKSFGSSEASETKEPVVDPKVNAELWYIGELERHLDYLRLIASKGYACR